jgi:hypothetical protein
VFTWAASNDQATGGSAIFSYRIYRNGAFIGETSGTSYTDGNVVVSGHQIYTVRAVDAASNISAPSRGLDLIVDLEGPLLDTVSFPAQRSTGALVDFQVAPRDALSPIAGAAIWDFGDGLATGNKVTHIFQAAGTYTITVSASDALGNTTIVANRSIRIVTPPGGAAPTVLRMKPIKNMALRLMKRQRYVTVTVYTDIAAPLEFTVERAGSVVITRTKRMPAGSSRLNIPLPRGEIRKGAFRVEVRATNADLSAARKFRVR